MGEEADPRPNLFISGLDFKGAVPNLITHLANAMPSNTLLAHYSTHLSEGKGVHTNNGGLFITKRPRKSSSNIPKKSYITSTKIKPNLLVITGSRYNRYGYNHKRAPTRPDFSTKSTRYTRLLVITGLVIYDFYCNQFLEVDLKH